MMERETDWKVPVALILAGLALFVALNGRNGTPFMGSGQDQPAQTIVIAPNPGNVTGPGVVPAVPAVPAVPVAPAPHFGYDHGFGFGGSIFKLLGFALLLLFLFKFLGWRRWQRPGGWGPGPWHGQPHQAQGPQPGQGPGHWEWRADDPPPQAPPPQSEDHGDIMRPGQGNQ